MKIQTTAGTITAEERFNDSELAWVHGSPEAIQCLRDGLQMSGGGDTVEPAGSGTEVHIVVAKEQLAIWVQFEILNYLTYTNFEKALA